MMGLHAVFSFAFPYLLGLTQEIQREVVLYLSLTELDGFYPRHSKCYLFGPRLYETFKPALKQALIRFPLQDLNRLGKKGYAGWKMWPILSGSDPHVKNCDVCQI
uniref:Uncharacterized protein n=1 Tax=Micrurus surinamensis TaxID=129470 RepID=A0A2D4NLF6_MICSU